jgi:hypothetical protein
MKKPYFSFLGLAGMLALPLFVVLIIGYAPPVITSNENFFTVSIDGTQQIDVNTWHLSVTGTVEHDLVFDYATLTAMPNVTEIATLQCVDGPSATASWTGVSLNTILGLATLKPGSMSIVFVGADGYTSSLALPHENASDVLLAWGMNGVPLPPDQGFPLRVVAPNNYGYKWVKWITQIRIVDYEYKGYWETRGWNNDAHMNTVSGWQLHAILFSIAFIFGGFAAISGKLLAPGSNAFRGLPSFVNRRFHTVSGILFLPLVVLSFVYWTTAFFAIRGALFFELHGIASLACMGFLVIGSFLGFIKNKKQPAPTTKHGGISMTGFYLFIITILLGVASAAGFNLLFGT